MTPLPYLSLMSINGLHSPSETRVHMALQVYYDGSGHDRCITLCGVAATEDVWKRFEPRWSATLEAHNVKDNHLHMCDLMQLTEDFRRENGWDESKRLALLLDLWKVISEFQAEHLIAYSCTVMMQDWRRCKEETPKLCSPQSICVNFCAGGLHLHEGGSKEPFPLLLYFDKNEKFMHKINRVWQRRRRRRNNIFNQIGTIENADWRFYPIQLADMIAWTMNRANRGGDDSTDGFLIIAANMMIKHFSTTYDYDSIVKNYPNGRLLTTRTRPDAQV